MITLVQRQVELFAQKAEKYQRKISPNLVFFKELLMHPREVGACCPSSVKLANAMAAAVDCGQSGFVVELGGGTGIITRALLQHGVAPNRLITVERSPTLAALLRKQFPQIRVIEGDASILDSLLPADVDHISAVVSGLPFRSLPKPVVMAIKQQIKQLLSKDGVFVQFSYNLAVTSIDEDEQLKPKHKQLIWANLPPARVDVFRRT